MLNASVRALGIVRTLRCALTSQDVSMAALGLWEALRRFLVQLVSIEKTLPGVNPDGALPVGGDVDGLLLSGFVVNHFHARDLLFLIAVLAVLAREGVFVKRDVD